MLDVGGEGLLKRFLRGTECVSVNVDQAGDVQYGAKWPARLSLALGSIAVRRRRRRTA